jgi:hypothetical protein
MGYVFISALKAPHELIHDGRKVCHIYGYFFFYEKVGDASGKIAFSRPYASPEKQSYVFLLHSIKIFGVKSGFIRMRTIPVIVLKGPQVHGSIRKAVFPQLIHGKPVTVFLLDCLLPVKEFLLTFTPSGEQSACHFTAFYAPLFRCTAFSAVNQTIVTFVISIIYHKLSPSLHE